MASRFGDVVIVAGLLDPQGRNPKDRACVIVTKTVEIAEGGPLDVVAITTLLPDPLPFDHVPLPWHRQGHARTGLNKKNAAVCSWLMEVEASRLIRAIGHVPGEPMLRIESVLRVLRGGQED
jgi:mRNA-degrading endonuclease toxin of MazEF toxin-antitoxin module